MDENYYEEHDATVRLLVLLAGPVVSGVVRWVADNIRPKDGERVEVYEWHQSLWYVSVSTDRVDTYPENCLFSLTVNLKKDTVFWCGDQSLAPGFPGGGNCYVRSERWSRLLRKRFPGVTYARDGRQGQVHDYRPRRKRGRK